MPTTPTAAVVDVIEHRETDTRCPVCRAWCRRLTIDIDGELRCSTCLDAGKTYHRASTKRKAS